MKIQGCADSFARTRAPTRLPAVGVHSTVATGAAPSPDYTPPESLAPPPPSVRGLIGEGNTLESLLKTVLGLKQRGVDGARPFDRTTGEGFVAACDGDYADALRKKRSVVLFNTESSGAVGPRGVRLLAQLGKDVRRKGAVDGTVYGTAATSTRSFFVHHLSAVAAGVKHADALTLDGTPPPRSPSSTRARPAARSSAGRKSAASARCE